MSTISQQLPPPPPMHRHRSSQAASGQTATTGIGATESTTSTDETGSVDGVSAAGGSGVDATSLDPSSLKDRIDGLLAQQVQSGTLTSAQADTLKGAFGTLDSGSAIGQGGKRPHGPPPGPQPGDASAANTTIAGPSATTAPSTDDLLASFVKQLQSSQTRSSAYGADGGRSNDQAASSLLLNFKA